MNKVSPRISLLMTSVGMVFLLAGCEDRPGSKVSGARHAPVLNQEMLKNAPQKTPAVADKTGASPYDTYDNSGHPKSAGSPAPQEREHGLLDGMFSSSRTQKPEVQDVRKPIAGNPYYSKDTQAVAPVGSPLAEPVVAPKISTVGPTPTGAKGKYRVVDKGPHVLALPASSSAFPEAHPVAQPDVSAASPVPEPAPQEASLPVPQVPVQAEVTQPEEPAEQKSPSLLSRVVGEDGRTEAQKAADDKAQYVPLQSVPPKPERFEEIKKESDAQLEQMQNEKAQAEEDKKSLAGEQSDLADSQNASQIPTVDSHGQPVVPAAAEAPKAEALPVPQAFPAPVKLAAEPQGDATPAAAVAASTSSLPSPAVLKKIKAVPAAQ